MESNDDCEQKVEFVTPEKQQRQSSFFDEEVRRPSNLTTGIRVNPNPKGRTTSNFPPTSPTDQLLSPCSRKLMRKKTSMSDSPECGGYDLWAPPASVDVILGSSSRCRRDILNQIGWSFSTMTPDIDERAIEDTCHGNVMDVPAEIAKAKAAAILAQLCEQDAADAAASAPRDDSRARVVITSDQVVLFEGQVRGKPRDAAEARAFLASYGPGTRCQTVCAVVATHLPSGRQEVQLDVCSVLWSGIPAEALEVLLAKEEVFWSCGGFLIEDEDFLRHVESIDGSVDSIRGLPIKATKRAVSAVLASATDAICSADI